MYRYSPIIWNIADYNFVRVIDPSLSLFRNRSDVILSRSLSTKICSNKIKRKELGKKTLTHESSLHNFRYSYRHNYSDANDISLTRYVIPSHFPDSRCWLSTFRISQFRQRVHLNSYWRIKIGPPLPLSSSSRVNLLLHPERNWWQ
jgi:hypothetical protein